MLSAKINLAFLLSAQIRKSGGFGLIHQNFFR